MVDQVDGVDAVDFQIGVQIGLWRDALGFDLEQFDQRIAQRIEDVLAGMHRGLRMR
ncbi:hypothetical protein D3C85_1840720 [compost metagenome]